LWPTMVEACFLNGLRQARDSGEESHIEASALMRATHLYFEKDTTVLYNLINKRQTLVYKFAAIALTAAHVPQLCFSFVIQDVEGPSVLRRAVVEDVGIRRNEGWLEGPSLGGESVNTELADANKLWCSDGARHEFTKAIAHLIIGKVSGGEAHERTIRFDLDEENEHAPFVDDVMDGEVLRSFDTLVLGRYLVVL
jgi:hypothetical protein